MSCKLAACLSVGLCLALTATHAQNVDSAIDKVANYGSGFDLSAGVNFSTTNLSYDANGNILTMRQYGFMVGGSNPIDELQYSYQPYSNKLNQVYDTANSPTSQLGDFHWTGTKQASDYGYDGNGNQTFDNNRGISYVHYNNLSLADSIVFTGKGYIKYVYDASGKRLQKATVDNVANKETITTYIGGFLYSRSTTPPSGSGGVDTLQLMAHEEGRIRWAYHRYINGIAAYKFEYDFFEKDKQGNIRMVLTQEHDTTNYLASMGAAYRSTEQVLFGNLLSTCYAWSNVPNSGSIPSGTKLAITNPNDSVAKVDYNGSTGQTNGPSLLLKVMGGDTVSIGVQSFYNTNTITTTNSSLSNVLSSLATALVGTPTGGAEGTYQGFTSNVGPVYAGLSSFLSTKDPAPPSGYPKAYLNWIFLDDQFNYVSGSSGSVAAASSNYPAATLNPVAPGGPIVMPKNGYLYVWVSNETQGWDVFFDNLSVQYKQGPVLEENHYYPFGLTMAGISDKAMKGNYAENKYRYNAGSELQNKEFSDGTGWEMYEDPLRGYDAQIGRFAEIDPLSDKFNSFSTYQYALNNPLTYNDPTGADISLSPELLKIIQVLMENSDPGFSQYTVGEDGQPILSFYDPNPVAGSFRGQDGVWVNSIGASNDGAQGHYWIYSDAFVGGQMNTATYTHKFFSLPALMNDYSDYIKPGFWDYAKAVGNVALGGVEIVASGLTGGLAAPILGVDGASRMVLGVGKIATLATEGKVSAENKPSTLLGVVGSVIGGQGSRWQKGADALDNVGAMLLTGGLIGEGGVYSEMTEAFAAGKTGEAIAHGLDGVHMAVNTTEANENAKGAMGSKE
jgi:RHS repeat-associated protein